MKTVGIITTFRQPNWGSVLQAYATQKIIDSLGFESTIIDYLYPNKYHFSYGMKAFYQKPSLKRQLVLALGLTEKTMMELLNEFISKNMKVSKVFPDRESLQDISCFDYYLSGSDQIWNPYTMHGDMSYFFDFAPPKAKKISFSSSFSCNKITEDFREKYKKALLNYKALSVRENNGKNLIKELTGRDSSVVLDPTLMLDKQKWELIAEESSNIKLPKHYILCYMLGYTFNPSEAMNDLLNKAQKELEIPVIFLESKPSSFKGDIWNIKKNIGISEFLYLIKKADLVITSSFHGTAFSLNFSRPFISLIDGNSSSDDRISTLVNSMNLSKNLVSTTNLRNLNKLSYNYDSFRQQDLLNTLRIQSFDFLRKALDV